MNNPISPLLVTGRPKGLWVLCLGLVLLFAAPDRLLAQAGEGFGDLDLADVMLDEGGGGEEVQTTDVSDPIEPVNRVFYALNEKLFDWVLKPVSTGYREVIPEGGRLAVDNVFHNLATPIRFVNDLLQFKGAAAGNELGRFVLNSTLGVLGLFDVAALHFGLHSEDEDLGQTLGHYGAPDSVYLVWPILGPSNLRDSVGDFGDGFIDPLSYYPRNFWDNIGVRGYKMVNETSLRLEEFETIQRASLDPYLAVRSGYLQMRRQNVDK